MFFSVVDVTEATLFCTVTFDSRHKC